MDHTGRTDPDATPPSVPRPPGATEPLHIHEATVPPVLDGPPVFGGAPVTEPVVEPTAVLPVQPVAPVRAAAPALTPVDPLYAERRYIAPERKAAWPYVLPVFALLAGGLGGFLLGAALDDDEQTVAPPAASADGTDLDATLDALLERTRTDGEYRTPSEHPQLDEITEIDTAAATAELQNQVAVLTAAQEEAAGLTDQVALLETSLADLTTERDELAAQLAETGATDTDTQAQLDAANDQIATLESDLATARTELEAANEALATAQADLAAATERLDELNVVELANYVNGDIARARADAAANGWTLIEEAAEAGAPAGTVLEQVPAPAASMVRGSVLYVTVAENV